MILGAVLIAGGLAIAARMRSHPRAPVAPPLALAKPARVAPLPPPPAEPAPIALDDAEAQDAQVIAQPASDRAPAKDASPPETDRTAKNEPPPAPEVDELVLRGRQRREDEAQMARWKDTIRRVQITVYYAEWCGVCTKTRRWLSTRGFSFTEVDVEKDLQAKETYLQLNPRGSIPTLTIDGKVLIGFSELALASAIEAAARKRLGL